MRYQDGQPVKFPTRVLVHMVAARYGTSPDEVRDWPADDFLDAVQFLGVTNGGK